MCADNSIVFVCSLKSINIPDLLSYQCYMPLFTAMFTAIILVYSLNCMCISTFVLIGCCFSELHGHVTSLL